MSRAFVNEDSFIEEPPDRPISDHPDLVIERGLELIDAALEAARRECDETQAVGDREALAKAGRELRYWSARRASAIVVRAATETNSVRFGGAVTIVRDDGRDQTTRPIRRMDPFRMSRRWRDRYSTSAWATQ